MSVMQMNFSLARLLHPQALRVDMPLLLATIGLVSLGLVMVASASIASAEAAGNPFHFAIRQAIFIAMGGLFARAIMAVPLSAWMHTRYWLLALGFMLLLLVLIPAIGKTVNGSTRWIPLGIFNLQVSEPARLLLVMYLAAYLVERQEMIQGRLRSFMMPVAVLTGAALLMVGQPDLGAAVVLFATGIGMIFLAGGRLLWIILLGLAGGLALALLIWLEPYRMARVVGFLDPWADPFDKGFQLVQSLIAIGSGGLFGAGLGASVQKMFYLPEAHTDFVFAVLAEELGMVGVMALIGLYAVVISRAFVIAGQAKRQGMLYGAILAYGLGLWIGLQAVINMAVNMGLLPTKGLTLPMMSYGGSSMIVMLAAIGLLLRIHHEATQAPADKRPGQRRTGKEVAA